ncbi:thiopurine S-methyltransferase [Methylotenera sp.]|uniref:thiopurine S-methyltransferase n=1 Tax=Methylotenera sp. TaxID=2051956 RepID=UPI0027314FC8|nr:thiopurine S-methyltransferase [Methylotenera sp.]MDP2230656.1 thiopurine S-methyltransferase [Methylotenera sp.]MDP3140650.1 thiopurine S-methyltransferase [Methylotenera sp.]MDP3818352.1 thiopurine S-methyltransferase [Methylotenera sp.]
MDAGFWHQKWEGNDIAFHENEANPLLIKHFRSLSLAKGSRIFVPLCGKTRDIAWLLTHGYRIAGAELSKIAIVQLFTELGIEPKISSVGELEHGELEHGQLEHYSATNIDIFVGDIFNLSGNMLGQIDAIYDRAALVALPLEMRNQYAAHLMQITNKAPQLLICFEYDQSIMSGPPFSISNEEVNHHYSESYELNLITGINVLGGLKGKCAAIENVWLLKKD